MLEFVKVDCVVEDQSDKYRDKRDQVEVRRQRYITDLTDHGEALAEDHKIPKTGSYDSLPPERIVLIDEPQIRYQESGDS